MTRLADVADVIRSKNAGPYELTLDIIFTERFWFEEALRCELISGPKIARILNNSSPITCVVQSVELTIFNRGGVDHLLLFWPIRALVYR